MIDTFDALNGPAALRRLNQEFPQRYPFLLQSASATDHHGRFDILFAFPGEELVLEGSGQLSGARSGADSDFLTALDAWWQEERAPNRHAQLPFTGGWFVYLGYELASQVEPVLRMRADERLPAAFAVRCPVALVFDHEESRGYLVCESAECVDREQLRSDLAAMDEIQLRRPLRPTSIEEDDAEHFLSAVAVAKQHIENGDIYQANLSRQWRAEFASEVSAEQIYAALCSSNPAPFAGIARWRGTSIISSSPERLLSIRDGIASTRPIAGTRPRGRDARTDDELSRELIAHPKERAEHVMLIDLERNDLGRVCEPGSVEVDEFMIVESYRHVHHIVSNVRGTLRDDATPGEAIAAVFPGGTITGCPKVRCMQIIAQLEDVPRGAYTGSFGYLNRNGDLDLNILIRTMIKRGNEVVFNAGAGIVADSVASEELEETRAKAKGLLGAFTNG